MSTQPLALITGFGGINSAGRSSSYLAYKNMVFDSLSSKDQLEVLQDLAVLQGKIEPIGSWGIEIEKNAIKVNNATDYSTNVNGVYAIGDVNTYPGKLKLILCGFHEAAIMVQSAFKRIHPNKNNVLKYTTVTGIKGF